MNKANTIMWAVSALFSVIVTTVAINHMMYVPNNVLLFCATAGVTLSLVVCTIAMRFATRKDI